MQPLILYLVGAGAFCMGAYEYFSSGTVDTGPFMVMMVCLVSGAGIQVVRDLWRRFLRRRR